MELNDTDIFPELIRYKSKKRKDDKKMKKDEHAYNS